jgi:hypothetical protein
MYRAFLLTLLISQQWSAVTAGFLQKAQPSKATDWSQGEAAWKEAMDAHDVPKSLWTQPNYCDARVMHSSAPLTLLFGLSTFWEEIKNYRAVSGAASNKPLEIHVPGSAYPFEGRSDWSLLASYKPADIPSVRIVLVLGTPWHEDNVPVMKAAKEYNEWAGPEMKAMKKLHESDESSNNEEEFEDEHEDEDDEEGSDSFLQIDAKGRPEVGRITEDESIMCDASSSMAQGDKVFKKADLCRNHGNGLEVVCVEKYYQDAVADLPKPDLVVMNSPGFPQLARRSWDQVLRPLLDSKVPIMVNDILNSGEKVKDIYDTTGKVMPTPGSKWKVSVGLGEGGLTLGAMTAYEANEVGGWRSPFPIYIRKQGSDTGKSLMVQLFRGRKANAAPWEVPSTTAMSALKKFVEGVDWVTALDQDEANAAEVKMSLEFPCSTAYNQAMYNLYNKDVKQKLERMTRRHRVKESWKPMLEQLGLTGKPRQTPWTVEEWAFIITKLKFSAF